MLVKANGEHLQTIHILTIGTCPERILYKIFSQTSYYQQFILDFTKVLIIYIKVNFSL